MKNVLNKFEKVSVSRLVFLVVVALSLLCIVYYCVYLMKSDSKDKVLVKYQMYQEVSLNKEDVIITSIDYYVLLNDKYLKRMITNDQDERQVFIQKNNNYISLSEYQNENENEEIVHLFNPGKYFVKFNILSYQGLNFKNNFVIKLNGEVINANIFYHRNKVKFMKDISFDEEVNKENILTVESKLTHKVVYTLHMKLITL